MAALILGAGALLSERIKERHRKRNQNKLEYASRFEEFQAENERRELQRQSLYQGTSLPQTEPSSKPPGYDVATNPAINEDSRRMSYPSMSARSRGRNGTNGNEPAAGHNNHTTQVKPAQGTTVTPSTRIVS